MSFKALIWGAGLIVMYITVYVLNHRTPKPEGCEEVEPGPQCRGCALDCSMRKKED